MIAVKKRKTGDNMNRPYVICHIVSSVDGKIDGEYFRASELKPCLAESNRIRNNYECKATLYGATTMAETYAAGFVETLPTTDLQFERVDYLAHVDVDQFFISVDIQGTVAWENKYIEKRGRPRCHPIVVLCENVSDDYIAYLRSFDISYIFAGKETLDCKILMEKLYTLAGIERLMIAGGGIVDYTFLQAGFIDELSLVVVPLTDGLTDTASVFDRATLHLQSDPVAFKLLGAEILDGDTLWIRYEPKNRK